MIVPLTVLSTHPGLLGAVVVTFGQTCNFCNPKWIDPFFKLIEEHFTFHLQYTDSGMFANRKIYEELCLTYPQKIQKCVSPF